MENINKNDTAISSVKLPLIGISSKNTAKNIIVKIKMIQK